MSNPYAPPEFPSNVTPDPEQRAKLRRIAKFQQWVLYALLASILSYIILFMAALARHELIFQVAGLIWLFSSLFALVAVILLAMALHGPAIGILCAILMFIPCVSLITLIVLNGQASTLLKAHGIKVGLMGANPNTI